MSRVNRVERLFRRAGSNDASEDHRTTDGTAGGVARRSRLLADVAVRTTVTRHLSEALAGMRRSRSRHAPGRILVHRSRRSQVHLRNGEQARCSLVDLDIGRPRRDGATSARWGRHRGSVAVGENAVGPTNSWRRPGVVGNRRATSSASNGTTSRRLATMPMSQLPKIAAVKSLLIARTIPAQLTLSMWPRSPGRPRLLDEWG
jgi:hypothetical protein